MSSRQEQKEQRRQERIAAEQVENERKERLQRLYWIGGAVLGLAAIAAVIIAAVGSGGGKKSSKHPATGEAVTASAPVSGPTIPAAAQTNLQIAAKAAGCTLRTFESEGRTHSENTADWKFKTNPPTSGTHSPVPAEDGVYPFGGAPNKGEATHALEHGRINIQYGPALTRAQFNQLQTLMSEDQGYHQLLYKNQTGMPFAVAATGWTQQLGCKTMSPRVFDAIRDFKERYTDQAPEAVP